MNLGIIKYNLPTQRQRTSSSTSFSDFCYEQKFVYSMQSFRFYLITALSKNKDDSIQ